MKKLLCLIILLGFFASAVNAQKPKPAKPKPEEEETGKAGVIKKTPFVKRTQMIRTKSHQKLPTKLGGMNFGVISNEYLGFGASYEINRQTPFGVAFNFYYYIIPDNKLFFDPYYYQYVQRNKGSMLMLTAGAKYHLPVLQNEPNINPYTLFGGGGVLGIENDLNREWPGSMLHAYTIGGYTTYAGVGVEYRIKSWAVNFDTRYQFIRFPKTIFGVRDFDGIFYNLGIGKLF